MHAQLQGSPISARPECGSGCAGLKVLGVLLLTGLLLDPGFMQAQPGGKLWEFSTGDVVYGSPAVGSDGTVYCGSLDGKVYAITSAGALRWSFNLHADIVSSPALGRDETVYIGARDHRLYAIAPTGVKRWDFMMGGNVDSSPAVGVDGALYVGSNDGRLYAINPDGTLRWSLDLGDVVYSSPAVDADGTVYVGAHDNALHAITHAGVEKWRFPVGSDVDSSPAIGPRGVIYFGANDSRIYAVKPDGTQEWVFRAGAIVTTSPCVGPDGTIYAADHGGTLYALTPGGTNKWTASITGRFWNSSPALTSDGLVCLGANDGKVYAFGPAGAVAWTFTTAKEILYSSPAITRDGKLYIGSADRKIYALGLSAGSENAVWPMFRRDPRHTASGFVVRELPPAYSPGAPVFVALRATPTANTPFYTVEDSPPGTWQVSNISDDGLYDPVDNRVRFGPFSDGAARVLTYTMTPPANETGVRRFQATSTLNGADRLVGGDQIIPYVPLHPADNQPFDAWMTLEEVTSYGAAWKRGQRWPLAPSPITARYLDKAIELWRNGEAYFYDTNFLTAPLWWTLLPTRAPSRYPAPPLPPADVVTAKGDASADMPKFYHAGVRFTVTVTITPSTNVVVYAMEELPPVGWKLGAISGGGVYDNVRHKIKWGPYFDMQPRTVTYEITPGTNNPSLMPVLGVVAFDDQSELIDGRRQVVLSGTEYPPTLTAAPVLDPSGFQFTIQGIPGEIYEVQASTDLIDWTPLARLRNFNGTVGFQDPTAPPLSTRFYRVFWP